ncbi:MAG: hypothetical protein H0X66_18830 [Verrucomicrobia bacterium]|nr:hypothetical protein [Verrucomicrobiota bacterium]
MKKDEKQPAPVIQNSNNPAKPNREQIRTKTPRINPPRQSSRPILRSGRRGS